MSDPQPPAPLTTAPCCTSASCAVPGPHGHVVVGAAPVCALCRHEPHDSKRCDANGCECFPGETIYESPAPQTCSDPACQITEPHKHVTVGAAPAAEETCPNCLHGAHVGSCSTVLATSYGTVEGCPCPPAPSPPSQPGKMSEEEFEELAHDIENDGTPGEKRRLELLAECRRAREVEESLKDSISDVCGLVDLGRDDVLELFEALVERLIPADKAEAERDRLREAIEKIAAGVHDSWKDANCERIARAALEGR